MPCKRRRHVPRPEKIRLLCNVALDAMNAGGEGSTAEEIYLACLCVARQAVATAIKSGCNLEAMRAVVARIYQDFPPEKVN